MARQTDPALYPPKLRPGDHVRLVSPASTPKREGVERFVQILREWGLKPEIAPHVFDKDGGFMAGTDESRLADLNEAIQDPTVRAIFATRGGAGAYRIADGMDFSAMRNDPKLLVGFSDISALQLALWKHGRVASVHGGMYAYFERLPEKESAEKLRSIIMTNAPTLLHAQQAEPTSELTTSGKAEGTLMGGNQDMIATTAGWTLPSFEGTILFLEDIGKSLGCIDRQLTMLIKAGALHGVRGVAIGQYIDCGPNSRAIVSVLRDRLSQLNVPLLGGLAVGHGNDANPIPLGTRVILDANAGTLTMDPVAR